MPKGIYERHPRKTVAAPAKEAPATSVTEVTPAMSPEVQKKVILVASLAHKIRAAYERIQPTVLEIGKTFLDIKHTLDEIDADARRIHKIPMFSTWMNKVAPIECSMSRRSVWNYYRMYLDVKATGLNEKTITALAPTILNTDKARKAVVTTLTRHPELVDKLNSASTPRKLRELADAPEIKHTLERLSAPALTPKEKVTRAIVAAFRHGFENADAANESLEDLVGAIEDAAKELGVAGFLTVTAVQMAEEDLPAAELAKLEATPVDKLETLPMSQKELIENVAKAIAAGSAKVAAVGR